MARQSQDAVCRVYLTNFEEKTGTDRKETHLAMDHAKVAKDVLAAVGGASNINAAAHCATRLRLVLADQEKVDQPALDNNDDVKGTFLAGGMYQIIIGPGDVDVVYDHLIKDGGVSEVSKDEAKEVAAQRDNIFMRFVKTIADIFVPVLPALIAGGLMMALNNVLTAEGLIGQESIVGRLPWLADYASMINLISSAAFAFLPVLIGFSAVKRFGGNPYLGAAMGAAMVSTGLVNAYDLVTVTEAGTMPYWHVFGLDVAQVGYQGQVIPVLCVAWILAWIEKRFHKIFSGTADFLLTPLFTMLITGFLALIAVGPVTRILADGLSDGILWAYTNLGPFGGLLFGLFYSPIVVTGLHQSFPAIELPLINNMATTGGSFIFPIASMANVAQGAAAMAVFVLARNPKLKGLAGASSASALFGITEPAIFGVNLRLRWPFFIGMGGGAIGGALVAIFDVRSQALGAAGLVGFVSIKPSDIPMFLIIELLVIVVVFLATLAYGKSRGKESLADANPTETTEEQEAEAAATASVLLSEGAATDFTVTSPIQGNAIPLGEVEDKTFASGMLGPGGAIQPAQGPVVSPVDGTVILAFPSGHAYGIRSASGIELLIHVGMDTVKMNGAGFTPRVKKGDTVARGDVLVDVDWNAIKAAGYQTVTPIVVSNGKKFSTVEVQATGAVNRGDLLLIAQPKEAAASVAAEK